MVIGPAAEYEEPVVKEHNVLPLFSVVLVFTSLISFFGYLLFGSVTIRTLLSILAASKEAFLKSGNK